jgi:hypothetical protein
MPAFAGDVNRAFRDCAGPLHAAGYSPLPIIPGTKRPALRSWSDYCAAPMTPERIRDYSERRPAAGLGVALGFGGVLAIDVDTVDDDKVAAICAIVPPSPVAKTGAKGWTAFYRASAPMASRHYADAQRRGILDLLGVGTQTVLPPSPHPNGFGYRWTTPDTLLTVPACQLPEIPADIAEQLREALAPWCVRPAAPAEIAVRTGPAPEGLERRRLEAAARAALMRKAGALAQTGAGGRNCALFALAAGLGRFIWHGILPFSAMEAAALHACAHNGLTKEDGRAAVLATLRQGLERAKNDPLPILQDRDKRAA